MRPRDEALEGSVADSRRLARLVLSSLGSRWKHVQGVGRAAERFFGGSPPFLPVIHAAWLHDLGYAPALEVTGFHAIDGALYLQARSVDETVVGLVAHHTGAAFEAEERGLTRELRQFAEPELHLLDALNFLDLTVGPDGEPVMPADRIAEILSRYDAGDVVHRAVTRSGAELVRSAERGRAYAGFNR